MANSNTFEWTSPDPFASGERIRKKEILGELQWYYFNTLREEWVPKSARFQTDIHKEILDPGLYLNVGSGHLPVISSGMILVNPNPSGEFGTFLLPGLRYDFTPYIVPSANSVHLSGMSVRGNSLMMDFLRGYRQAIQSLTGLDWAWLAPYSDEKLYHIDRSPVDIISDISYKVNKPTGHDWVTYLREAPDFTYIQDFSLADLSFLGVPGFSFGGSGAWFKDTSESPGFGRDYMAMASAGPGSGSSVIGSTGKIDLVAVANNSGGTLDARMYLPLYKLDPSPNGIASGVGLPYYLGHSSGCLKITDDTKVSCKFNLSKGFTGGPFAQEAEQWTISLITDETEANNLQYNPGENTQGMLNPSGTNTFFWFRDIIGGTIVSSGFRFPSGLALQYNQNLSFNPSLTIPSLWGQSLYGVHIHAYYSYLAEGPPVGAGTSTMQIGNLSVAVL